MQSINTSFLVSLSIILLGYIAKRFNLIKESDGEGISRIVFNFTLPAIVITTFSNIQIDKSLLAMPCISIAYGTVMTFFAFFIFRKLQRKEKGMLAMLFPAFNIGLFAYPLVEAIWGNEGLKYFGMFDMGNSLMVFGVAYLIACVHSGDASTINFKKLSIKVFSSIPFLSYIVTLPLNLLHLSYPSYFLNITKVVAKANMPLSLLLLGTFLSFSFELKHWQRMAQILAVRYTVGISIGLLLYFFLPFEPMFKTTLLLGLCLPISLAVVPFSVEFGYDNKFVGTVNNATIMISFALMWIGVTLVHV
jgi:predicted permease